MYLPRLGHGARRLHAVVGLLERKDHLFALYIWKLKYSFKSIIDNNSHFDEWIMYVCI